MDLLSVVVVAHSSLLYGLGYISLQDCCNRINNINTDIDIQLPYYILENEDIQLMTKYACCNKDMQLPIRI